MKYRLVSWILLFIILMLVINIIRSFFNLRQRGDVISQTQEKLQSEKEQQEELNRQLARVESPAYIEKEARNKLNLGREREIVLILPSISPIAEPTPTIIDKSSNWQKWIRLFF